MASSSIPPKLDGNTEEDKEMEEEAPGSTQGDSEPEEEEADEGEVAIAYRTNTVMPVDCPGRIKHQKLHLHSSIIKGESVKYNAAKDGPHDDDNYDPAVAMRPTADELIPLKHDTTEYMIVGFICGRQPNRFVKSAGKQSIEDNKERAAAAEDNIDEYAVPVVRAITEFRENGGVCYAIGPRMTHNRRHPKSLSSETSNIFVFQEFQGDVAKPDCRMNAKTRESTMKALMNYAVAQKKDPPGKDGVKRVEKLMSKMSLEHPLVSTQMESLQAMAYMQFQLLRIKKDPKILLVIEKVLEKTNPDLAGFGPYTPDAGVLAFLNFRSPLKTSTASELVNELKDVNRDFNVPSHFVQKVHQLLRNMGAGHHGSLPRSALPFFLEQAWVDYRPHLDDDDTLEDILIRAIDITKRHSRYANTLNTSDEQTSGRNEMLSTLTAAKDMVIQQQSYYKKVAETLKSQFGEFMPNANLNDLMTRAAQTATVDGQRVVQAEIAHYMAFSYDINSRRNAEETDALINEMLAATIDWVRNGA